MSAETITTAISAAAIIGFLWSLHRDMQSMDRRISHLGERMARLAGAVDLLTKFLIDREHGRSPS